MSNVLKVFLLNPYHVPVRYPEVDVGAPAHQHPGDPQVPGLPHAPAGSCAVDQAARGPSLAPVPPGQGQGEWGGGVGAVVLKGGEMMENCKKKYLKVSGFLTARDAELLWQTSPVRHQNSLCMYGKTRLLKEIVRVRRGQHKFFLT